MASLHSFLGKMAGCVLLGRNPAPRTGAERRVGPTGRMRASVTILLLLEVALTALPLPLLVAAGHHV